jgi:hypothetical protein
MHVVGEPVVANWKANAAVERRAGIFVEIDKACTENSLHARLHCNAAQLRF